MLDLILAQAPIMAPDSIDFIPNYHPLIVHFPIVLLIFAPFLQAYFIYKWRSYANNYAYATLALGVFGAALATFVIHPHTLPLPEHIHNVKEEHEFFAYLSVAFSALALAVKSPFFFRKNFKKPIEIFALVLMVIAAVAVAIAGHEGAELVHQYGIGPRGNYLDLEHRY